MKHMVLWKAIVHDVASEMSDSDLTKKYNLSGDQLRSIFKRLANLRERRIQMLAGDLRSGMESPELMEKYQLSAEALAKALKLLLEANAIGQDEFETFRYFDGEQRTERYSRRTARNHPIPVVTICEVGKPGTRYLVRDISENGIGVTGINAQIDETKLLAVVGDEFGEIAPFEFEAQCRWARQLEPDGGICAGFRITRMGEQDLLRLREFIQGYTFGLEEA
ncbi:MAG: PilZ domain-containing protein [Desulfomonilaceae bacterium]